MLRRLKITHEKFYSWRFRSFSIDNVYAMILRKKGLSIVGILIRLISTMRGSLSPSIVQCIKDILYKFHLLAKSQGIRGLVKYLKNCSVHTQQAIAGSPKSVLTPRVATTNAGLPRLLPVSVRNSIRLGHVLYMKLSLTMFSLYRDMVYPSPAKIDTIISPYTGDEKTIALVKSFIPHFVDLFLPTHKRRLINKSVPATRDEVKKARRKVLEGKFSFFPILKSSPASPKRPDNEQYIATHPWTLVRSAAVMEEKMIKEIQILERLSTNQSKYIRPLKEAGNPYLKGQDRDLLNILMWCRTVLKSVPKIRKLLKLDRNRVPLRKLGLKQEAAGKMRVFAMVDPWTQFVMAPFHKCLFTYLKRHNKIDGTFDQLAPLQRAWAHKSLYSMDLSSATDRLPMAIQLPLIREIFDLTPREAEAWKSLLVDYPYKATLDNRRTEWVHYAVGQPMGALSSWAMLAFTHHLIVQAAAWTSNYSRDKLFTAYALLGDDIVIFDSRVAKKYKIILDGLGVECNLAKSILSKKGIGLEFAKKTFYRGNNVSPTPLSEFHAAIQNPVSLVAYAYRYNLSFAQMVKAAGFGYRVLGNLSKPFAEQNLKIKILRLLSDVTNARLWLLWFGSRKGLSLSTRQFKTVTERFVEQEIWKIYSSYTQLAYKLKEKFKSGAPGRPTETGPMYHWYQFLYELIHWDYIEKAILTLETSLKQYRRFMPTIEPTHNLFKLLDRLQKALEAETAMSPFSLEILKMTRSDAVYVSDPKPTRYMRAWDILLKRLSKMKIKEVETLSTSAYRESAIPILRIIPWRWGLRVLSRSPVLRFLGISIPAVVTARMIPRIALTILWRSYLGLIGVSLLCCSLFFFADEILPELVAGGWSRILDVIWGPIQSKGWIDSIWHWLNVVNAGTMNLIWERLTVIYALHYDRLIIAWGALPSHDLISAWGFILGCIDHYIREPAIHLLRSLGTGDWQQVWLNQWVQDWWYIIRVPYWFMKLVYEHLLYQWHLDTGGSLVIGLKEAYNDIPSDGKRVLGVLLYYLLRWLIGLWWGGW